MARIGYARVSTNDQDHGSQEAMLKAAGSDVIRAEKVSGKSREEWDELVTVLDFIREAPHRYGFCCGTLREDLREIFCAYRLIVGRGPSGSLLLGGPICHDLASSTERL